MRKSQHPTFSFLFFVLLLSPSLAQAQSIAPAGDRTNTRVIQNGNRFDITGGQLSTDGANLFQSFERFGLNQGQVANFLATPAIRNILGRVVGGNPSYINGLIQLTGGNANLILMNPAGILFGSSASLNVPASFTATTASGVGLGCRVSGIGCGKWFSATGENAYAALTGTPDTYAFTMAQPGAIVNAGNLAVPYGQSLTLLGGTVVNTGQLSAPGGQITIAAVPGENLVRLSQQDSLLSLEFQPITPTNPPSVSSAASLPQLLTGGNLGNATGLTVNPDGTVQLTGSGVQIPTTTGTAIASGQLSVASLSATPHTPHPTSQINVLGDRVALSSANLDASGVAGGGTIRIGGDFQGKGTVPNALQTAVSQDSTIRADALSTGNGGRVIVWADQSTNFGGRISARGGQTVGNGGFAEVSGKENLNYQGSTDLSAANGSLGTLLLDPTNITIVFTGPIVPGNGDALLPTIDSTEAPVQMTISQTALENSTANVSLAATNDITIGTPASGGTLVFNNPISVTFTAGGLVSSATNQGIDAPGSNITITAGSIRLGTIDTSRNTGLNGGNITLTATTGNISTANLVSHSCTGGGGVCSTGTGNAGNAGAVQLTANNGQITTGNIDTISSTSFGNSGQGGDVTIAARDGITTGTIAAYSTTGSGNSGNGGAISLTSTNGGISIDFTDSSSNTNSGNSGNGGAVSLITNGNISTGGINSYTQSSGTAGNGGAITLATTNGNISTDGSLYAVSRASFGNRSGNGGDVTLSAPTGSIEVREGSIQTFSSADVAAGNGGRITLSAGNGISVEGISSLAPINSGSYPFDLAATNSSQGGAITLSTTNGDIIIGANQSGNSVSTSGGEIRLDGQNLDISGSLDSSDFSGANTSGGAMTLNAEGNITIGGLISSDGSLQGGNIRLTSRNGDITIADSLVSGGMFEADTGSSVVNRFTQTGGTITLQANNITATGLGSLGEIQGGEIRLNSNGVIKTGVIYTWGGSGGNVSLSAKTSITTEIINASGSSGNGGNVTLDPSGDVQVSLIDAQGGTAGRGGTVDITAGTFFRATSSFIDQTGILASISTAGGLGGGAITIRHGGGLSGIPFEVGNASTNGTAAAITTGISRIDPFRSFLGAFAEGSPPAQIQLVTLGFTDIATILQPPPGERSLVPPTAQIIPRLAVAPDLAELEETLTDQFTAHLELPGQTQIVTLSEAQSTLRKVEAETGVKPAILYINFAPARVKTEAAIASTTGPTPTPPDPSENKGQNDAQLELLLVTATGKPLLKWVPAATRATLVEVANQFRYEVADPSKTRTQSYLPAAQQLYRWLIAPLEAELKAQGIQTIVFVMDSGIRFIPLAALHDGQQFLIEKYSLGLMPTLSLTDTRFGDIRAAQVLAAGASVFTDQNPLPAVPIELSAIQTDKWQSQRLFNETFTLANLKQEREEKPFGIIHLATHGEFLPGKLSDSYIQLWDTRLRLNQLRSLGWNNPPVELVVLSACRMALGDIDAELGFAGFAVQAGAKSALASLWNVSDEGTSALMAEFYQQLRQQPIKAAALRQAQLEMINKQVRLQNGKLVWANRQVELPPDLIDNGSEILSHPYFWSAFTLVGSPW
ncbi:CHAT domain-containing protein [Kovacikia minuta CCNUW1]|uniref:CHAT domain-containing protein n=1 Tax=Kovacikia minuta TaxID=2931930 RepID=UPI001CCC35B3|nr:CHAT domain-containing protein [Kovacikia minuta]UBF26896.1 CHAT domain-containing protein [Kovacikia minuta CCNUW1]